MLYEVITDQGRLGEVATRGVIAVIGGKETVQLGLGGPFAVIEQEGDQGGKVELSLAGEGRIRAAMPCDEGGIGHKCIYGRIRIFKFDS